VPARYWEQLARVSQAAAESFVETRGRSIHALFVSALR
jgi:hypothetical protein